MSLFLEYARSTDLYKALCQVLASEDGNLLEQTNIKIAEAQTEFLRWALCLARPSVIIEIGTNKGMFLYFASLVTHGVTIHTFDKNPLCARAVELINQSQGNVRAVFHEGDTRKTLKEETLTAQFAWIDGGHDADIPLHDLMQCYRMRAPYLAVDDTAFPTVASAVEYVVQQTPYKVKGNPFLQHDRRRALLLHLDDGR